MYGLSKKEKIDFITEKVSELNLTAYEISKKTNLTEAGIRRVLDGTTKNPHENTLNTILLYLEEFVTNTNPTRGSLLEESKESYGKQPTIDKTLYQNQTEINKMLKHIVKLQNLLSKKNIPFEDYFEQE